MKKTFSLLTAVLFLCGMTAEADPAAEPLYDLEGTFVIRGQQFNPNGKPENFTVQVSNFFGRRERYEIEVDANGAFEATLPVTGVQDLWVFLGQGMTPDLFSYPGDTIVMRYDRKKVRDTFVVEGTDPERTAELRLCWEICKKFKKTTHELWDIAYAHPRDDQEVIRRVNEFYDEEIDFIDRWIDSAGLTRFADKFRQTAYYEAASIVNAVPGALEALPCRYPEMKSYRLVNKDEEDLTLVPVVVDSMQFNKISLELFRRVPMYRSYLSLYLGTNRYFNNIEENTSVINYHKARGVLWHCPEIRDWYLYSILLNELQRDKYNGGWEKMASAYEDYTSICRNPVYLQRLSAMEEANHAVREIVMAPDFELPDTEGNTVRISDFRGNVVYMDFWGVGCGTCYYHFMKGAKEMKEKYRDHDIVYLYLCIQPVGEKYKPVIEKYELDGIHLIVDNWKNPVIDAYNVTGMPVYHIIDKEGKLAGVHAPNPMILAGDQPNILDEILSR